MTDNLRVNIMRLRGRLEALADIGALEGGGATRLALTDEDKAGRDLVVSWMKQLGLEVSVDRIGNVVGLRRGAEDGDPVMTGSHIDTVAGAGIYDGCLGVLAGLEVVQCLDEAAVRTRRPLAVAFFTNEEGARFQPDMMGSMVHQGHLHLEASLDTCGNDGTTVGEELRRIGYMGDVVPGSAHAHAFVELHVEQGPVLENEGVTIGAVEGVQGISWTEVTVAGQSNHAGTTPMSLRRDAGLAAARVAVRADELTREIGGGQVATVGAVTLEPNLINVIASKALLTVDLRNTDEALLAQAEARLAEFLEELTHSQDVEVGTRQLARFAPVVFDQDMVARVEDAARSLGLSVRRMPSGAGHDAQSFARNCPTAMIFVPSVGGISHNVKEHTRPADLEAGANTLLRVLLETAQQEKQP